MRVVYILWGLVISWMVAALYFGPTKRIPDIDPDDVPAYRGRPPFEDAVAGGDCW